MDLGSKEFDLRACAEAGSWCQLVHPVTGVALGLAEGKPARIFLEGIDSRNWEMALAETAALNVANSRKPPGLSAQQLMATVEETHQNEARQLAKVSRRWENLEWEGRPVDNEEMAKLVYGSHKWVREQLFAHAGDRAKYAGNGSAP